MTLVLAVCVGALVATVAARLARRSTDAVVPVARPLERWARSIPDRKARARLGSLMGRMR